MTDIPQYFPTEPPLAIASYNYMDIAQKTGMNVFYLFSSTPSTGLDYFMDAQALYSSVIDIQGLFTGTPGTFQLKYDYDYDLTQFNVPATIGGTGLIQFPQYAQGSPGQTAYNRVIWKVRKWDGTTETEIASAQSQDYSAGNVTNKTVSTIPITIPKTHFKKGETLRLTGLFYVDCTASGGAENVAWAFDPKNRDGTYIIPSTDDPATTTTSLFICPFVLDL